MRLHLSRVLTASLVAAGLTGCGHLCHNKCSPGPAVAGYRGCSSCAAYGPASAPRLQPQPVYQVPPGVGNSSNYPNSPPPPLAPGVSNWQPAEQPIVRLSTPEATAPEAPKESASAYPPGGSDSQAAGPSLPVGIPQFAEVKSGRMASGLKPHATDGLSWLQAKGFRAILHVRRPGEDDSAERRLVEKHGLRFFSLETSPDALTRETADEFNRLVGDPVNQPIFVYDRDGLMAGGLWYLHFRMVDNASADAARNQARRLGLKDDATPEAQAIWAAVERILPGNTK